MKLHTFISLLILVLLIQPAQSSDKAVTVNSAPQAVEVWKADQHLYYKKPLEIPVGELDELEKWLDKNAPHWTVLIFGDVSDETWGDDPEDEVSKRSYLDTKDYAVKKWMEQKLMNSDKFKSVVDQRCHRSNGMILAIFPKEKSMFFLKSKLQESVLGYESFDVDFEYEYRKLLYSSKKFSPTVKKMISLYDARIERRYKLQLIQRSPIKDIIDRAHSTLNSYEKKVNALKAHGFTEASKSFSKIISPTKSKLNDIYYNPRKYSIAYSDPPDSYALRYIREAVHKTMQAVFKRKSFLEKWLADKENIKSDLALAKEIQIQDDTLDARQRASRVLDELETIQQIHRRGSQQYEALYEAIKGDVYFLNTRKSALLQKKTEKPVAPVQKQFTPESKNIFIGTIIFIIAIIAIAVFFLLRRIKKGRIMREKAVSKLETWKAKIRKQDDHRLASLDRAHSIVGQESEINSRGYSGKTKESAVSILEDINRTFILSSKVHGILNEAEKLIEPEGFLSKVRYLLSSQHYKKHMDFHDDKHVRIVNASPNGPHMEKSEVGEILGLEGPAEWELAPLFVIVDINNKLLERANKKLDTLDDAWVSAANKYSDLEKTHQLSVDKKQHLISITLDNDDKKINSWFKSYLVDSQQLLDEANGLMRHDPLTGNESEFKRIYEDMRAILVSVIELHDRLIKQAL